MRSRCFFWWTALSASLSVFVGKKLSALGEIIAHDLEHSYGGVADDFSWPVKGRSDRSAVGPGWQAAPTVRDVAPEEKVEQLDPTA